MLMPMSIYIRIYMYMTIQVAFRDVDAHAHVETCYIEIFIPPIPMQVSSF